MFDQRAFLGQVPIVGMTQTALGQYPVNYPLPTEPPPPPPTPEQCREAKAEMDRLAPLIAHHAQEISKQNTAAKEALRKGDYIASDHASEMAFIHADALRTARMYYGFAASTYTRCPQPQAASPSSTPTPSGTRPRSYTTKVRPRTDFSTPPPPPTPTPSRPRNIPQGAFEPTPTQPTTFREQGMTPTCPPGQFFNPNYPERGCQPLREGGLPGLPMGPSASVAPMQLAPMSTPMSFMGRAMLGQVRLVKRGF